RCGGDRDHFRFIVSPDDAEKLSDLRAFTRDLMTQAERDLRTGLDWVAIHHWNTQHPHITSLFGVSRTPGATSSFRATTSAEGYAPARAAWSHWRTEVAVRSDLP